MYDCDAAVLLNVYIYLVFLGEGYGALVRSHLHLRELYVMECDKVRGEYRRELDDALRERLFM